MVTEKVKQEVYDRDNGACQGCGTTANLERTPHHCLFKSGYFGKDRDQAWNLVMICRDCHIKAHAGNPLRNKFELLANKRHGR